MLLKELIKIVLEIRNIGFTLIELLVVVGVIGILAYVLIAVINPVAQLQKGRDLQRKSDLKQIQSALEHYSKYREPRPLGRAVNAYSLSSFRC